MQELQSNRATEQQSIRATEQQSNRAPKHLRARDPGTPSPGSVDHGSANEVKDRRRRPPECLRVGPRPSRPSTGVGAPERPSTAARDDEPRRHQRHRRHRRHRTDQSPQRLTAGLGERQKHPTPSAVRRQPSGVRRQASGVSNNGQVTQMPIT